MMAAPRRRRYGAALVGEAPIRTGLVCSKRQHTASWLYRLPRSPAFAGTQMP